MTAKCVGARDSPRALRNQGQRRNGLRFWWGFFFRGFGLHQAGNVQRDRASFFLSVVAEADAHGSGYLVAGKHALVQGRAGLEGLVAALVVATGAPCHEKLLARGEQADARLFRQRVIGRGCLAGAPRADGDAASETEEGDREGKRRGFSAHGCLVFYSDYTHLSLFRFW